jgi:hypothetical protein
MRKIHGLGVGILLGGLALAGGCSSAPPVDEASAGETSEALLLPLPDPGRFLPCRMRNPLPGLKTDRCADTLQGYALFAPAGTTCPALRVPEVNAYWFAMTSTAVVDHDYSIPKQILPPSPDSASCIYPFANLYAGFSPLDSIHFVGEDILCRALGQHPEFHYTSASYFFPIDTTFPGIAEVDIHGVAIDRPPPVPCTDGDGHPCDIVHVGTCGSCINNYSTCPIPIFIPGVK